MKHRVIIINTSRGALIDTKAVLDGILSHKIHAVCLDVYEDESKLFFLINQIIFCMMIHWQGFCQCQM